MLKSILGIIIILLLVSVIYLLIVNHQQSVNLDKQAAEIEALNRYSQMLNDKVRNMELEGSIGIEHPRSQQINELLRNFLRERDNQTIGVESGISTEELRKDLEEFQLKQRFIPNLNPIHDQYVISQSFKEEHPALDYAAPLGTEVVAAASGVIKSSYEDKYFGNVIIIDHLNHYMTLYAHLARTFHQEGFFVEKGQAIGLVGSTGFSKYPHLHYEIIYRGENINPEEIVEQ